LKKLFFLMNARVISLTLFLNYLAFNTIRRAFTVAGPILIKDPDIDFSLTSQGNIQSAFYICYGLSKFISAIVVELVPVSTLLSSTLLLSGSIGLAIGFLPLLSKTGLVFLWGLQGLIQGAAWPSIAILLLNWIPRKQRGGAWSLISVAGMIGQSLTPFLMTSYFEFTGTKSWRLPFITTGGVCVLSAVVCFINLRDRPAGQRAKVQPKSAEKITFKEALCAVLSVGFLMLVLNDCIVNFTLKVLSEWLMIELQEKDFAQMKAAGILFSYDTGMSVGALLTGPLSDHVPPTFRKYGSPRILVMVTFSVLGAFLQYIIFWDSAYIGTSIALFGMGYCLAAPKSLGGMVVRENAPNSKIRGTRAAVYGSISQIVTAASGYPVARVIQSYGWLPLHRGMILGGFIASASMLIALWTFDVPAEATDKEKKTQ